jgi:hypothetical protein
MASIGEDQALLFGGWDTYNDAETWLASGFTGGVAHRTYLPLVTRSN